MTHVNYQMEMALGYLMIQTQRPIGTLKDLWKIMISRKEIYRLGTEIRQRTTEKTIAGEGRTPDRETEREREREREGEREGGYRERERERDREGERGGEREGGRERGREREREGERERGREGRGLVWFYWGLTPQQQPGSYHGGEMMMMKSVIWWRKPEYPEETTDREGGGGRMNEWMNVSAWVWESWLVGKKEINKERDSQTEGRKRVIMN